MGEIRIFYKHELKEQFYFHITKKEDGCPDRTDKFTYDRIQESLEEFIPDVSSTIGLFLEAQTITLKENEQFERCLADLLLYFLYPHLKQETGTRILIQGPPLPKLIGRIGYRYPCPDLTIAFVTVDDRYFSPPSIGPFPNSKWDGPFPDLQNDSLIRRFYNMEEKIRVDLFAQGLNRYNVSHIENDIPYGIRAKLEKASGAIIGFSKEIREMMEPSKEDKEIRPNQKWLPYMEDEAEVPLDIAARPSLPKQVQSSDPPSPSMKNYIRNAPVFSDEETYCAIFKDIDLKTGQRRFEELSKFFSENEFGMFCENTDFLRFIKRTLEYYKPPKSWVFSQGDLKRWFKEKDGPEDHGSMMK